MTPSCRAASPTESPTAGKTSSRRIAPGCVGGRVSLDFAIGFEVIVPYLMVLLQVNLPRLFVAPLKSYAPGAVDVNAVSLRLASERMEVEARDVRSQSAAAVQASIQSPQRPAWRPPPRCRFSTLQKSSSSSLWRKLLIIVRRVAFGPKSVSELAVRRLPHIKGAPRAEPDAPDGGGDGVRRRVLIRRARAPTLQALKLSM